MTHTVSKISIALAWFLAGVSCTATSETSGYSYSATIWEVGSEDQKLLVTGGATDQKGGYLGHYFREPVQIMVQSAPEDSATIGALWISSPTAGKCLPIKKWTSDGKTIFAICDLRSSVAVVSLEAESRTLDEPLLQELLGKFVPGEPETSDG